MSGEDSSLRRSAPPPSASEAPADAGSPASIATAIIEWDRRGRLVDDEAYVQNNAPAVARSFYDLLETLRKIESHWACQYDHPRKETEMYRGAYGIGVTDGHRAAASIARIAINKVGG